MLTEVEFHTGLEDASGFACRLLRKAVRQGARVSVLGTPAVLDALDRRLWTFDERDFIAHARVPQAAARVLSRSPIWLVDGPLPQEAPDVVVNLGLELEVPPPSARRLIEVVSSDPEEASRGRRQWRVYREQGLRLVHHTARGVSES